MLNQKVLKAGIYCRLSQDDGNVGDSSSIQTQRITLEKYCKENNFEIIDFYIDDGWSGTNFNRPSFQRMINDVEKGKINLVITKDLSRLGRDYIQTGYYSEVYFPERNVRYIAINDNFDSSRDDNDIAPFKNILNDMYAKDLSKKVKSALRQRALQGMYLGADAPYGYLKNPDDNHKLIIDSETAGVVKKIYNLVLSGYGTIQIARLLSKEKILTPAAYKLKNGNDRFHRHIEDGEECRWSDGTIKRIIKEQIYVGDMVNQKTQSINHKTRKIITNGKDKQIIVPNTHEAIISREDFERVQKLKSERHCRRKKYQVDNLFRGLLKCSVCGKSLILTTQFRRGRLEVYYHCNAFTSIRTKEKHWNTIKYDDIKDIVIIRLKELLTAVKDDKKVMELIKDKINTNKNIVIDYSKELSKIEIRKNVLSNITKKVYEDFFAGLIDNDTYLDLIKKYQNEQKELKAKHENLLIDQSKQGEQQEDIVQSFLDLKVLKQEIIYGLIDRIEIANIGGYKQHKQRKINITYRFIKPE